MCILKFIESVLAQVQIPCQNPQTLGQIPMAYSRIEGRILHEQIYPNNSLFLSLCLSFQMINNVSKDEKMVVY
jgi:hypothetical protein